MGGWVGGDCVCVWVGKVWSFLSPLARVFEAQLSSLPQHVVPRTVPTRRHQLTEIALPDGCRVPYGGGLRRAQQVSSHPRADCCYARRVRRRSSSSRGSNARRPSSPPSSTTRRPLLSPVLGRAAAARCRVGGALPMTNIRLIVKHGCSHAQPCSGASLGTPLPPRCRGRGALFDLGYYLASGGRRRRCRGGGELPVANARLTVQDGGSRPRPCSGVPL